MYLGIIKSDESHLEYKINDIAIKLNQTYVR